MAVFPTSVPTNADLYIAINTGVTALTAGIDNVTLTIPVTSTTGFPAVGAITIDSEIIHYTSVGPTQFNADARGFDGTAANSHLNGAQVNHFIIAAHHNAHKDEIIAIAQNLSDRIGLGATSLKAQAGTAALPTYTFAGDLDTGLYNSAANNIGFAANGVQIANFSGVGALAIGNGTVSNPAYRFLSDLDTGMYTSSADQLDFATGGIQRFAIAASGLITSIGKHEFSDGSVGTPSLAFSADPDTGIYRITTNAFGFVTGGTEAARISDSAFLVSGRDFFVTRANAGAEVTGIVTNNSATSPSYARVQAIHNNGSFSANISLLGYMSGTNLRQMDLEMTGVPVLHGEAQGGVSEMALKINVSNSGQITAMNIPKTGEVQFQDGSATLPAVSFQSDPDTGMYRSGTNNLAFATNGAAIFTLGATTVNSLGNHRFPDGSASTPSLTFTSDTDTGIYRISTGRIGISGDSTGFAFFDASTSANSLQIGKNIAGTHFALDLYNGTTNTASDVRLALSTNDGSSGDPYMIFAIGGPTTYWAMGVDNDNSDRFCIAVTTGAGTAKPGTGNILRFTTGGQTEFSSGTVGAPGITWINDQDTGFAMTNSGLGEMTWCSQGTTTYRAYSTHHAWYTSGVERMNLTGGTLISQVAGGMDLGSATNYWNEINYKTLTDRGCIPWCDDGVELVNGTRVSDLDALCSIAKHPTQKTVHGLPKLDYRTFPKAAYRPAMVEGSLIPRTKDDEPSRGEDGVEMTMMFGVMIGAFKQLKKELDDLKASLKDK